MASSGTLTERFFSWWNRAKSLKKAHLKPFLWASFQVRTVPVGWENNMKKTNALTSGQSHAAALPLTNWALTSVIYIAFSQSVFTSPSTQNCLCGHLPQIFLFYTVFSPWCTSRPSPRVSGSFVPKVRAEERRWPGPGPTSPAAALQESWRDCVPTYFYIFRNQLNAQDYFIY